MMKIWDMVQSTPPWFLKKLRSGQDEGKVEDSDQADMDQISILPKEILSMIFENLDFESLKQARLVSKLWHGEAEFHMKTRGTVCLHTQQDSFSRIAEFLSLREKKEKSGDLPEPFKYIELDLARVPSTLPSEQQLNKLITSLPLVLTRFSAGRLPLRLTFPILLNASSTLEYLKFDVGSPVEGYEPHKHPEQLFPTLRTVVLHNTSGPKLASWSQVSSIVAWVVNGSPDLQVFHSLLLLIPLAEVPPLFLLIEDVLNANQELRLQVFLQAAREYASELFLRLDLKTVKTLKIPLYELNDAALEHLQATPFNRLQHLKLYRRLNLGTVAEIVKKSKSTLKTLALLDIDSVMSLANDHGFPVCSSLEALTLQYFPDKDRYFESLLFLSHHFPRLQELNALVFNPVSDSVGWGNVRPFFGLKTLRMMQVSQDLDLSQSPGDEYLFLRNFPDLETLYIVPHMLIKFCTLKATGDPVCGKLLEGIKNLGLRPNYNLSNLDFSCVSVLKGLETISFDSSEGITTLRVEDMPCLKMIRFPWDRNDLSLKEHLKMARRVEKVVITNCCSLPVYVDERSKEDLNKFFQFAPNVVCGCSREWKGSSFRW